MARICNGGCSWSIQPGPPGLFVIILDTGSYDSPIDSVRLTDSLFRMSETVCTDRVVYARSLPFTCRDKTCVRTQNVRTRFSRFVLDCRRETLGEDAVSFLHVLLQSDLTASCGSTRKASLECNTSSAFGASPSTCVPDTTYNISFVLCLSCY